MKRLMLAAVFAALILAPHAAAWSWPVDGAVLKPFVFDPAHPYAAGQHRGVDVAGVAGSDIRAPVGGAVSFAGSVPSSGKTVTIQTQDGYSVTLVHLGSIIVARGAVIARARPSAGSGRSAIRSGRSRTSTSASASPRRRRVTSTRSSSCRRGSLPTLRRRLRRTPRPEVRPWLRCRRRSSKRSSRPQIRLETARRPTPFRPSSNRQMRLFPRRLRARRPSRRKRRCQRTSPILSRVRGSRRPRRTNQECPVHRRNPPRRPPWLLSPKSRQVTRLRLRRRRAREQHQSMFRIPGKSDPSPLRRWRLATTTRAHPRPPTLPPSLQSRLQPSARRRCPWAPRRRHPPPTPCRRRTRPIHSKRWFSRSRMHAWTLRPRSASRRRMRRLPTRFRPRRHLLPRPLTSLRPRPRVAAPWQ